MRCTPGIFRGRLPCTWMCCRWPQSSRMYGYVRHTCRVYDKQTYQHTCMHTHPPMQAQDCLFLLGLLSKAHIALDSGMLLELLSVATHTGHAALTQGVPRLPVEWVVSVYRCGAVLGWEGGMACPSWLWLSLISQY